MQKRYKEFICGWTAGCIETCLLFPQTKVIFRQQLHNLHVVDAVKQLKREGFKNLYRGLLPPLIQRTTNRAIMFGTYENYRRFFGCPKNQPMPICHMLCSFLAGATEACLCPFERVQSLLQTSKYQNKFHNTGHAFKVIFNNYQLKEFFRGFSMVVMRNGCGNICFFSLREPISEFGLTHLVDSGKSKMKQGIANFISGGLLGALISTIVFPFNVVRARMQSKIGVTFCSPLKVFRIILAERNGSIPALYRGGQLNFTRSVMTWGITNSLYELLMKEFFRD